MLRKYGSGIHVQAAMHPALQGVLLLLLWKCARRAVLAMPLALVECAAMHKRSSLGLLASLRSLTICLARSCLGAVASSAGCDVIHCPITLGPNRSLAAAHVCGHQYDATVLSAPLEGAARAPTPRSAWRPAESRWCRSRSPRCACTGCARLARPWSPGPQRQTINWASH